MAKRKKRTRYRGTRTHGRGRKNRFRGSGNRGGVGMAGTGKRGDAKKTLVIKLYGNNYFGKSKTLRRKVKEKPKTITLENIKENIHALVKKGIAKEKDGIYEINLNNYKIIGNNDTGIKMKIHARAATKGAQEAVKQAGGEITLAQ